MFLRGILCAPNNHWKKGVRDIWDHHADSLCFLLGQTACQKIRPVIEVANGRLYALAKFFPNVQLFIDDGGDRENGNSRFARYIVDASRFA